MKVNNTSYLLSVALAFVSTFLLTNTCMGQGAFDSIERVLTTQPGYSNLTLKESKYGKAAIYKYTDNIGGGTPQDMLLQVINLNEMTISQMVAGVADMGNKNEGKYAKKSFSPEFQLKNTSEMFNKFESKWGDKFFSFMNTQFMEDPSQVTTINNIPVPRPKDTTQFSFPIEFGGETLTGGSSNDGPGGANCPNLQNIFCEKLKVLSIFDGYCTVSNYSKNIGFNSDAAIVCYDPYNHPGANNTAKIHILFPWDSDGDGTNETLLVFASYGGILRIKDVADAIKIFLHKIGVPPSERKNLICLDGGGSTFIKTRNNTYFEPPLGGLGRNLSGFLGFREKGDSPVPPVIENMNAFEEVKGRQTMYVIWYDNVVTNDNVDLHLVEINTNKTVLNIDSNVAGNNIYRWVVPDCIPDWNATKQYGIRISLTNTKLIQSNLGSAFTIKNASSSPSVQYVQEPMGLTVDSITANSALLQWSLQESGSYYKLRYKTDDFANTWKLVPFNIQGNDYSLNNLIADTTYKWQIKHFVKVGGITYESCWKSGKEFTTLPCLIIQNPSFEDILVDNGNKHIVNWIEGRVFNQSGSFTPLDWDGFVEPGFIVTFPSFEGNKYARLDAFWGVPGDKEPPLNANPDVQTGLKQTLNFALGNTYTLQTHITAFTPSYYQGINLSPVPTGLSVWLGNGDTLQQKVCESPIPGLDNWTLYSCQFTPNANYNSIFLVAQLGLDQSQVYVYQAILIDNLELSCLSNSAPLVNKIMSKETLDAATPISLSGNNAAPNPFLNSTMISFPTNMLLQERAILEIYDVSGKIVKKLYSAHTDGEVSSSQCRWDATDQNGKKVAKGLYIYRLANAKKSISGKILYLGDN